MLPVLLKFDGDCLIVLQKSLLAVKPEEGCALLIGEHVLGQNEQENLLHIRHIWPCSNIWDSLELEVLLPAFFNKINSSEDCSRNNRFVLDPRQQILAQKWARAKNWEILGSAHSHPNEKGSPSILDRKLAFSPGIMAIVDGSGEIRCWFVSDNQNEMPVELEYFNHI